MHRIVRLSIVALVGLLAIEQIIAAEDDRNTFPISKAKSLRETVPWKSTRIARADPPSSRREANDLPLATAVVRAAVSAASSVGIVSVDADRRIALDTYRVAVITVDRQLEEIKRQNRRAPPAIPAGTAHIERERPIAKPALPPELEALSKKIDCVLAVFAEKHLNTAQQSPWEVMHRLVAYGIPTEIRRDGPDGRRVNAIGWLLYGGRCNGMPLMVTSGGAPAGRVGPGLQGHPAQFLGMLAQSGVSSESPFELEGKSFTVADLIEQEKLDCNTHIELTFKLIALSYYLKSDETWRSRDGQQWSVARLVQEEIHLPLRNAACGGTHRLFGLSSSYIYRAKRGQPVDGVFQVAQSYIRDYQRYTLHKLQNSDGSLSTDWFNRPADADDMARKIQTTGHMLEWLVFSLPDDELRDPRVIKSVDFIATTLDEYPDRDWSVGPLGHALHALVIYNKRVFGAESTLPHEHIVEREPLRAALAPTGPDLQQAR